MAAISLWWHFFLAQACENMRFCWNSSLRQLNNGKTLPKKNGQRDGETKKVSMLVQMAVKMSFSSTHRFLECSDTELRLFDQIFTFSMQSIFLILQLLSFLQPILIFWFLIIFKLIYFDNSVILRFRCTDFLISDHFQIPFFHQNFNFWF